MNNQLVVAEFSNFSANCKTKYISNFVTNSLKIRSIYVMLKVNLITIDERNPFKLFSCVLKHDRYNILYMRIEKTGNNRVRGKYVNQNMESVLYSVDTEIKILYAVAFHNNV